MSVEHAVEKLNKFENKNQSSFPVWNIERHMGKYKNIQFKARTREGRVKNYQLGEIQFAVLNFTISGLSNNEIADILGTSTNTVKKHLANLGLKFGVSGRVPIIARLIEEGVLTFEPKVSEDAWVGIANIPKSIAA